MKIRYKSFITSLRTRRIHENENEYEERMYCCFILLSRKSVVVRTFLTVCELMYGPCDALESTAMTTPLLKMKPSVVVP